MTNTLGRSSQIGSIAAAVLAGLMLLSALHAAAPHHGASGPCVACQTLSAPALVPLTETPGRPPAQHRLEWGDRREAPPESSAPRLRPLRAPPRSSLA